jgi:hypothetical protein
VRRLLALLAAVASLVLAGSAAAEIVTIPDDAGRPMTFDVREVGVDAAWYADLLKKVAHGDEIRSVVIRIVSREELRQTCGRGASACYGGRRQPTIVVRARTDDDVAHSLVHEYGHHIDATYPVAGVEEPNGTPGWWAARGMADYLTRGEVARDYSLGWDRAIGEIFAEDYTQLHLQVLHKIDWLGIPPTPVLDALKADLANAPAAPVAPPAGAPGAPTRTPVVVERAGRLAPGTTRVLPFRLLGPDRRVTFTARVTGATGVGTRARLEVVCDGGRTFTRALTGTRPAATLDIRRFGPARCNAVLSSTSRAAQRYSVHLRLAVENAPPTA